MALSISPISGGVSIVLRGKFNPAIYSPAWFEKNGILGQKAEDAEVRIIHPDVTSFKTDRMVLNIDRSRFSVEALEEPWIGIHDFTLRVLGDLLPHTPVEMLGINRTVEFAASFEEREKIGNTLAPKAPWGKWGEMMASGEGKKHGGMRALVQEIRNLDDRQIGYIRIDVGPSTKQEGCIAISINDHYDFSSVSAEESAIGSELVMSILREKFESSIDRSEEIINQVMGLI